MFAYAAEVIPPEYHAGTVVTYQATAGMRLLTKDEQDAIYDSLHQGLMDSERFVFRRMKRSDLGTLEGDMEGFYGAVAANYLTGVVDSKLRTQDTGANTKKGPLGAMDMGGSSTQIVYVPGAEPTSSNDDDGEGSSEDDDDDMPSRLDEDSFFSVSHLAYGVDTMRRRFWDTLIQDRENQCLETEECKSKPIPNPCSFPGYELERNGYTFVGTGDAEGCVKQVQRLIPHYEVDTDREHRRVAGVKHPPLRGKFVAMSLYFFSLDSLRVLSEPSKEAHEALNKAWPNPSIDELHNALHGLCSRSWHDDLVHIQHNSHTYTRAEVLPHRCFESAYLATLLRDGYGFAPHSRDITFTFLVDGDEVEWSMGMALTKHAEEYEASVSKRRAAGSNNNTYEEECEAHEPLLT